MKASVRTLGLRRKLCPWAGMADIRLLLVFRESCRLLYWGSPTDPAYIYMLCAGKPSVFALAGTDVARVIDTSVKRSPKVCFRRASLPGLSPYVCGLDSVAVAWKIQALYGVDESDGRRGGRSYGRAQNFTVGRYRLPEAQTLTTCT